MDVNAREEHPYHDSSAWFGRYLDHQGKSFGVMVNPPEGVWQSEECASEGRNVYTKTCKRMAGTSILEHHPSKRLFYVGMVVSNLVSSKYLMTTANYL